MGFLNASQLAEIINKDSSIPANQKTGWATYFQQQEDPYKAREREAARLRGFEMAKQYQDQAIERQKSNALANSSQEFRDSYTRNAGQGAYSNFGVSADDARRQQASRTALAEAQTSYNKADRAAFQAAASGVGPDEAAAGITAELLNRAKAEQDQKNQQEKQQQIASDSAYDAARKKYIYGENNPDWSYSTKWA